MPIVFGVAIGGALGASARYGVDRLIERRTSSVFPWSTFTINVTGLLRDRAASPPSSSSGALPAWARVGLVVGVIGGYTTFSTFAQEALELGRSAPRRASRPPMSPQARQSESRRSPPGRRAVARSTAAAARRSRGRRAASGALLSSIRRSDPTGITSASGSSSSTRCT